MLQIQIGTWTGSNVVHFYTSKVSPGLPVTLANGTSTIFYWNGTAWTTNSTIALPLTPPSNLH
jgi:hypothetical protein